MKCYLCRFSTVVYIKQIGLIFMFLFKAFPPGVCLSDQSLYAIALCYVTLCVLDSEHTKSIHLNIRSSKRAFLHAYTVCAVNRVHTATQSCILPLK